MSTSDRRTALELGARAECAVADALESDGWTVLARNWRGGNGELDVVVERDGVLRFVEVKARAEADPTLADAVTDSKRRRLVSAARTWLLEHGARNECAFLVALVSTGTPWKIEWIDNAFDVR